LAIAGRGATASFDTPDDRSAATDWL